MPAWLTFVLVVVAIGYTIVRRAIGEPLTARELFLTPVVLLAVGGHQVVEHLGHSGGAAAWFWLGLTSATGLAFGVLRGSTVRLLVADGVLWQRYPARTYAVWALSLLVNGGLGLLAAATGSAGDLRSIPLSLGVGLLGEAVAVGARALATGVPFHPGGGARGGGSRPAELRDVPTVRGAFVTLSGARRRG